MVRRFDIDDEHETMPSGEYVSIYEYDALLAVLRQCVEALQKQFAYDRLYGQPIMERNLDAIEAARPYLERKEEDA